MCISMQMSQASPHLQELARGLLVLRELGLAVGLGLGQEIIILLVL